MKTFYFHSRLLGRENKFEFIFTPVYWEEKININLHLVHRTDGLAVRVLHLDGSLHFTIANSCAVDSNSKHVRNLSVTWGSSVDEFLMTFNATKRI